MNREAQKESELARNDVLQELCSKCPEEVTDAVSPRVKRAWATVSKESLRKVMEFLAQGKRRAYISTISAVDTGEEFQLLYHIWVEGTVVTLRVILDRDNPEVPSVMDLMPSANFYEREVRDLMGIEITGRGELTRLVVPDGWPEGNYPLRKDWMGLPGGDLDG